MKIKKTLTALSVVSILSLSLGGMIDASDKNFTDLGSVPGKDKIIYLQEQGIIKGVTATEFQPSAKLTSAQAIQLISKGLKLNLDTMRFMKMPQASDHFTQIKDEAWYAESFVNAYYNKIDIPKDIDPSKPMTKEQFTYHLLQGVERVGNLPMINLVPVTISDENEITPMYQGAIQRSLAWNINTLAGDEPFNPQSEITRSDAAIMVFNALEFLKQ